MITNTVRCFLKVGVKLSEIQSYIDKYNGEIIEQDEWGVLSIKCESEESTCNLANSLYESSLVKFSVPNMYLPIKPTSDPYYPYQFHLHNVSQTMPTHYNPIVYDLDIDAPEAWLITKGSSGIKVAVIGDGVEDHEDMNDVNGNSRVLDGFTYNCLFNCKGRPKQDDFGHEQACAGIIAASHNNLGVKGIAPNVKIVPIVIYKKKIDGYYQSPASAIARGINKSWDDLGSDIINNSNTFGSSHDDVTEAINNAINYGRGGKGCVVVCAAGNERSAIAYPANLGNTLAVGSEYPLGGINSSNFTEDHDNWDYTNFENNSKISIYPNPSSGYIHINTHKIKEVVKISIFDLHGKAILNKEINENVTIDISNQQKGVYYIKSVSGNCVEINKIILK